VQNISRAISTSRADGKHSHMGTTDSFILTSFWVLGT
jgi:hypothetical protein